MGEDGFPVGLAYKGSYEYVNEVNQTIEVNLYPMINNMKNKVPLIKMLKKLQLFILVRAV